MPSPRNRILLALLLAPALTGCADYAARRDSVTYAAGNAPETNLAIHTINPFPPKAWDTTIIADGHPVAKAQNAYNAGKVSTKIPVYTYGSSTSSSTSSTTVTTGN